MGAIKIPLILTLYGVFLLALLPLLIKVTMMLRSFMERYMTSLGFSLFSLTIIALATVIALYMWLKMARWFTNKVCKSKANEGSH
ncbi:MAG: hypothetical protein QW543_04305 [Sulfolobales archaeon]